MLRLRRAKRLCKHWHISNSSINGTPFLACQGFCPSQGSRLSSNALAEEPSAFLRNHALDPISWHPWSEGVIAKAQHENKVRSAVTIGDYVGALFVGMQRFP